jgi:transposase InsO family protein
LLLFLGPTQRIQLLHLRGGVQMWADLHVQYAQWQDARSPALQRQYDVFKPRETETVVALCNRFDTLCLQLSRVSMDPAPRAAIQHFTKRLKAERPAWAGHLQGLWQVLPRAVNLKRLRPGRVLQDSGLRQRLGQLEVDEADDLAPGAQAPPQVHAAVVPISDQGLSDRLTAIEDVLKRLQHAGPPAQSQKQKKCYACGRLGHLARDCPGPSSGNRGPSASGVSMSVTYADTWLLDSGTTHHMSTGNGAGAADFLSYRAFAVPQMVYFGKRGATAPAVGVGDLVVHGCGGAERLRGVLHVPDLAVSLFSVRAAVQDGMSVSFHPGPSGACVVLQRGECTVFTAKEQGGLFYLDTHGHILAATAVAGGVQTAMQWHRRLGHVGFSTLADLARSGLIQGCSVTAPEFMQARWAQPCEPCALGKMRRVPHPPRAPQKIGLLHRVHADLCQLEPGCYLSTFIDEASRYAVIGVQRCKSDTAVNVRKWVVWAEAQTGQRVKRIRHDRGGEYINQSLLGFYSERGIEMEPTAGYTPEANGIAERHNLRLLDMVLPMLADSADPAYGLPALSNRYAAEAAVYANDLHNVMPAGGSVVGRTPQEGFLGRVVSLGTFHRFGSRVWVRREGHRKKVQQRGIPGRFLGFERPFGGGIYRVLLDDGRVTQSQTVEFSDVYGTSPPQPPPLSSTWGATVGRRDVLVNDDGDDWHASRALPDRTAGQTTTGPAAAETAGAEPAVADAEGPIPGQLGAVGPATEETPAKELVTAGPEAAEVAAGESEAVEPAAAGQGAEDPAAEEPVAEELAADVAPMDIQPAMGNGHWQTQRAGQRPARTSRNPNPSYTSRANVAEVVGLDPGLRDRAGKEIGEQLGEEMGEQAEQKESRRRRRPGSRRVQRQRAARRRRQQRAIQCATPMPQVYSAGAAQAAINTGGSCWEAADQAEIEGIVDLGTWEDGGCVLPEGKQALPTHFVREVKRDGRHKSRLVAGGHKQRPGVDFNETFAHIAHCA